MYFNPPRMPKWTCPLIDRIIHSVESALDALDRTCDEDIDDYKSVLEDAQAALRDVCDEIEEVRTANSQLRACAEYWEEQCNDQQQEVETLKEKLADAMTMCDDLRRDLDEFNAQ